MTEGAGRLAIVLGGGGEQVIAWQMGVLAGLADSGLDPGAAETILGTSAGSIAAARLASGVDPRTDAEHIAAAALPSVPRLVRRAVSEVAPEVLEIIWGNSADDDEVGRRAGALALRKQGVVSVDAHVARQATWLPRADWPPTLGLVTIDARTGARVVLDAASGMSLAEGVAAARAVPGLVVPIQVGGRRLIDGAPRSATNADLIPDVKGLELAIVVAAMPLAAPPGSLEGWWNVALEAERSTLATRWLRVVVIHASSSARDAMGDDPMSSKGARSAVAVGREQGAEVGTEILVEVAT